MGFAGFAVDIGAWYSQAPSLQRASDAAALAGVVWRPNFSSAESAARAEATRNGFTHGVDGITVTVAETGNNRLEVEIVDTDADLYFASLFIDNITIGRRAVAEYVDSVPLGSPEGHFGTGDLTPGGAPAVNFWAAFPDTARRRTWAIRSWSSTSGLVGAAARQPAARGTSTAITTLGLLVRHR